jgi:N-acetylmuramoyl-L-alanine amidase
MGFMDWFFILNLVFIFNLVFIILTTLKMIKTLFVESGHGLHKGIFKDTPDCGATYFSNGIHYTERELVKELGLLVEQKLVAKNLFRVIPVGIDTEATIQNKMKYVNDVMKQNNLNLMDTLGISLHLNAGGGSGTECWIQQHLGDQVFAQTMIASFKEYNLFPIRKTPILTTDHDRFGRLYIDDTQVPWLLIESCFIDNATDLEVLLTQKDRLAECIAHGILEYTKTIQ